MAAGKHNSTELVTTFATKDMTAHITKFAGIELEGMFEDATTLGDTLKKSIFGGVTEIKDPEVEGWWDDTPTSGPQAVFGTIGASGPLAVVWGNAKSTTIATMAIKAYARTPEVGKPTAFKATLTNVGTTITEV